MAIASFDYSVWAARFPAIAAKVAEPLAESYFAEAGIYLNNTDTSPVVDVGTRLVLLNLLVAHIAALNGATAASAAGLVGRLSSVTEGSITISTEYSVPPGSAAWYAQTQFGAQYWAMTAPYRTMNYVPGPEPYLGVPGASELSWPR